MAAVGLLTYAVYYAYTHRSTTPVGPTGPPDPPGPPYQRGVNMFFQNLRKDAIWIIPTYGTVTDAHTPRWTDWPSVNGSSVGPYIVPHTSTVTGTEIQPGQTATMTVFNAGMASLNFIIRVGCQKPSMICKLGDSGYVPYLDGPGPTPAILYRNGVNGIDVPFKPSIDTQVEMSWGCAYQDGRLCGSNPSLIDSPTPAMISLMSSFPVWKTDGLLYASTAPNAPNILPPLTGGPGTFGVGTLTDNTFFDVSCVNGYTVPLTLKVRRPPTSVGNTGGFCRVNYAPSAPHIDVTSDPDWQTIANTARIKLSACPSDEPLWPAPKVITQQLDHPHPPGPITDGYISYVGQTQYVMPWLTQGMVTGGQPTDSPPVKLKNTFVQGVTTDLSFYRDPKEGEALPSSGLTGTQKIGCASACSALTQNRGASMLYPKASGHQFSAPSYLVNPDSGPGRLIPNDRGVTEICCVPGVAPGSSIVNDTNLQCNTTTWAVGPPALGPAANTDPYVNYAFGFYANVYAPSDNGAVNQWYAEGPTGQPQSTNPYGGGPSMSKFTLTVRDGATGQQVTTRAYTYAHDDAYSTVFCNSSDQVNVLNDDTRGPYYARYDVLMVIHEEIDAP